jgi:hypothetical protein
MIPLRLPVSQDDKPVTNIRAGNKAENYSQLPGHNVRVEGGEVLLFLNGYEEKVAKVHQLWETTHKNKPLSIAVRLGLDAAEVRRILGLETVDVDGFDGMAWSPEDNI